MTRPARTTIVQAVADLYDVVKDITQDDVTVNDTAPLPNQRPAGPSLYISPTANAQSHTDWVLTLEFSVQIDQPGNGESQNVMWRVIDAVEAVFDGPNDLGVGVETVWQSGTRVDLNCHVCSWTVTMPKENL